MNLSATTLKKAEEKEEKQEREAEEKEERHRNDKKDWVQLSERIIPINQNRVPQSIENTNESALSLSNITNKSNQIIAVSPIAKLQVPKRNKENRVSAVTDDIVVATKRKRINEKGDSSGSTALTTGSGSQSGLEQHDPKNGDKNKQNLDHQTRSDQQTH